MTLRRVFTITGATVVVLVCVSLIHSPLLYCTDQVSCFYPVSTYPHHAIAQKLRRIITPETLSKLQPIANLGLVAEIMLLMYVVGNFIRVNIRMIAKVVLLATVILYFIYRLEQHTQQHGAIDLEREVK
jgi:hypothetical protein